MKSISSGFVMGMVLASVINLLAQSNHAPESASVEALAGVAHGNGTFVAVGPVGVILTSAGGTVWMNRNSGVTANLHAVTFGNGQFVAVGDSGTILTSTNGVEWVRRSSRSSAYLNGVVYGKD